jgi:hypothetical protein
VELRLHNPATDSARVLRLVVHDAVAPSGSNAAISGFLFLARDLAVAQRLSGIAP